MVVGEGSGNQLSMGSGNGKSLTTSSTPDRNVLNILISRMMHLAHHTGQLVLVKHYHK